MQQNSKRQYVQIIKASLYGTLVLAILIIVSSLILYKTLAVQQLYFPLLLFCIVISGIFSGYISSAKHRKNGLINGVLSVLLPLIILSAAMFASNQGFNREIFIPIFVLLISGALGGILAVNIKRKKK